MMENLDECNDKLEHIRSQNRERQRRYKARGGINQAQRYDPKDDVIRNLRNRIAYLERLHGQERHADDTDDDDDDDDDEDDDQDDEDDDQDDEDDDQDDDQNDDRGNNDREAGYDTDEDDDEDDDENIPLQKLHRHDHINPNIESDDETEIDPRTEQEIYDSLTLIINGENGKPLKKAFSPAELKKTLQNIDELQTKIDNAINQPKTVIIKVRKNGPFTSRDETPAPKTVIIKVRKNGPFTSRDETPAPKNGPFTSRDETPAPKTVIIKVRKNGPFTSRDETPAPKNETPAPKNGPFTTKNIEESILKVFKMQTKLIKNVHFEATNKQDTNRINKLDENINKIKITIDKEVPNLASQDENTEEKQEEEQEENTEEEESIEECIRKNQETKSKIETIKKNIDAQIKAFNPKTATQKQKEDHKVFLKTVKLVMLDIHKLNKEIEKKIIYVKSKKDKKTNSKKTNSQPSATTRGKTGGDSPERSEGQTPSEHATDKQTIGQNWQPSATTPSEYADNEAVYSTPFSFYTKQKTQKTECSTCDKDKKRTYEGSDNTVEQLKRKINKNEEFINKRAKRRSSDDEDRPKRPRFQESRRRQRDFQDESQGDRVKRPRKQETRRRQREDTQEDKEHKKKRLNDSDDSDSEDSIISNITNTSVPSHKSDDAIIRKKRGDREEDIRVGNGDNGKRRRLNQKGEKRRRSASE
jgi:hypothetical protein